MVLSAKNHPLFFNKQTVFQIFFSLLAVSLAGGLIGAVGSTACGRGSVTMTPVSVNSFWISSLMRPMRLDDIDGSPFVGCGKEGGRSARPLGLVFVCCGGNRSQSASGGGSCVVSRLPTVTCELSAERPVLAEHLSPRATPRLLGNFLHGEGFHNIACPMKPVSWGPRFTILWRK